MRPLRSVGISASDPTSALTTRLQALYARSYRRSAPKNTVWEWEGEQLAKGRSKPSSKAKIPGSKHKERGPEGPGSQKEDERKTPEEEFEHWAIKELVIKKYSSAVTNYYFFIITEAKILNTNDSSLGILTSVCPSVQSCAAQLQRFSESDIQPHSQDVEYWLCMSTDNKTAKLQHFAMTLHNQLANTV